MSKIKRVTNLQKQIINQIIEDGTNSYYYDNDLVQDRALKFNVLEQDIMACVEYVITKFTFY